jgi:hypothetical protein
MADAEDFLKARASVGDTVRSSNCLSRPQRTAHSNAGLASENAHLHCELSIVPLA